MAKTTVKKTRKKVRRKTAPAEPVATSQRKWTVMVFMAASRDDQGVTEAAAVRDLRELELVGTTDAVRVVVQLDRQWPDRAERYRIRRDGSQPIPFKMTDRTPARTSSGDKQVLKQFLMETRESDKADNYLLVLWGHSFGLGFGRDHGDALSISELKWALEEFAKGGNKLDLLGANACAMSYAEAAFELRNGASYLVASEITMPFAGWPYANILEQLSGKDPEEAGLMIVDEFLKSYRGKTVALSLLDLQHAKDLSALKKLSDAVKVALSKSEYREYIAHAFQDTAHGDVRPLIDLKDLCDRLKLKMDGDVDVKSAATALSDSLIPKYKDKASAEANAKAKAKDKAKDKLVVFHQADSDFEGLNGVGIYAPVITSAPDLARLELNRKEYSNLALLRKASNWAPLVYDDLKDPLDVANAAVSEFVARTGAGTLEQRGGVSQLLVGVWRSFDKVDDALRGVEHEVKALLDRSESSRASTEQERLKPTPDSFLRLLPPPAAAPQPVMNIARTTLEAVQVRPPFLQEDQKPHFQEVFWRLEGAVSGAEKTISRALTNGTLGLGAIGVGNAGEGPVKGSLGVGERSMKFGFGPPGEGGVKGGQGPGGEGPVKGGQGPGGEGPVKSGQGPGGEGPVKGLLGPLNDGGLTMLNPAAAEVVDLFRAVAISLHSLEQAITNLEALVFGELPANFTNQAEAAFRVKDQIRRALRAVRDELTSASETSMLVLQHPVHGMGPAPGGLGAFGRKHLATRGGLTSGFLRLM